MLRAGRVGDRKDRDEAIVNGGEYAYVIYFSFLEIKSCDKKLLFYL